MEVENRQTYFRHHDRVVRIVTKELLTFSLVLSVFLVTTSHSRIHLFILEPELSSHVLVSGNVRFSRQLLSTTKRESRARKSCLSILSHKSVSYLLTRVALYDTMVEKRQGKGDHHVWHLLGMLVFQGMSRIWNSR